MVSAAARLGSVGVDRLPASLEKNQCGIAQESVPPVAVAKEPNFLVTPDSATSLKIKSTGIASVLMSNGKVQEGPPDLSALATGRVC